MSEVQKTEPAVAQPAQTAEATKPDATLARAVAQPVANVDETRAIAAFSSSAAFETAFRMAKALSSSSLMPTAFQGNVPNCMIALELASRIGASVFMIAQNLDIIHGRPGFRATFLIATVNTAGRFTPLRFRFEGTPGKDDWGCRAVAKDKESGEDLVGALITIGLAKAEGWYSRNGSKWKTMPEQMLMYRAASFWSRIYCPEKTMGMLTSDEVVDSTGYEVGEVVTLPAQQGSAQDLQRALMAMQAEAVADGAPSEQAPTVEATTVPESKASATATAADEPKARGTRKVQDGSDG